MRMCIVIMESNIRTAFEHTAVASFMKILFNINALKAGTIAKGTVFDLINTTRNGNVCKIYALRKSAIINNRNIVIKRYALQTVTTEKQSTADIDKTARELNTRKAFTISKCI